MHGVRRHHGRLPVSLLGRKVPHVPRAQVTSDSSLLRLHSIIYHVLRLSGVQNWAVLHRFTESRGSRRRAYSAERANLTSLSEAWLLESHLVRNVLRVDHLVDWWCLSNQHRVVASLNRPRTFQVIGAIKSWKLSALVTFVFYVERLTFAGASRLG